MRARTSIGLTSVTIAVSMLTLTACASPVSIPVDEILESVTEIAPEIEADFSEPTDDSSTKGLSKEAIAGGHTVSQMPSGWPDDLPLPEGIPVVAMRSGSNFSMIFDLASVKAGEDVIAWYEKSNWTIEGDYEMGGNRVMSFDSPETNDYGPLRRITLGLGMNDWPTGFQYSLEVRD